MNSELPYTTDTRFQFKTADFVENRIFELLTYRTVSSFDRVIPIPVRPSPNGNARLHILPLPRPVIPDYFEGFIFRGRYILKGFKIFLEYFRKLHYVFMNIHF